MADQNLQSLTQTTTPSSSALVYIVDNPATVPADRKVTISDLVLSSGGRALLTANRTYYVRTDGSDSNTGLVDSAGGAFLTIQKAITTVATLVTLGGYDVTIQVADGTYTGNVLIDTPWNGNGTVTLKGNISSPANVVLQISSAGATIKATNNSKLLVSGVSLPLSATSYYGLHADSFSYVGFSSVIFDAGASGGTSIYITNHSVVEVLGSYTINAGTYTAHVLAETHGELRGTSPTATLSGTPAIGTFMYLKGNSVAQIHVTSGSATGTKYALETGSGFTVTTSPETLPGNAVGTSDYTSFFTGKKIQVVTDSNFDVTSSTTLVDVTTLTGSLIAGKKYAFRARLFTTSTSGGGVKAAFSSDGTLTATTLAYNAVTYSGTSIVYTAASSLGTAVGGVSAVTDAYIEINGTITVNVAGAARIQFAQNASDAGASTVLAGSTFELELLA